MKVFACVAKVGSLSRAARELNLPLSTLSRILSGLECHLGATLIARTTRHLALTPAGVTYLDVCRRVIDDVERVEGQLGGRSDEVAGLLSVTAPVLFGRLHIVPIIGQFLERYPAADVRLLLSDQNMDLAKDGIDLAVRIGGLRESALMATRVGSVRFVTCASPAFLRRLGKIKSPSDLETSACISFANIADAGRWIYKSKARGRVVVHPKVRLALSTAEAAIDASIAGIGVTRVLSYQAADALKTGQLASLLVEFDDQDIPIHIVRRPIPIVSANVKRFSMMVAAALRTKFGGVEKR
ncbi:MAG: LysR family transcriptional regulator [Hyphomicrobium sp.]|nr:LysR family transcriptional regulator [Hyphomicrobium sp.]